MVRALRLPTAGLLVAATVLVAAAPASARAPLATCFWEGPISMKQKSTRGFDGRDFNFPEQSATYWLARFRIPAGRKLVLKGRYGHARYVSLNAYSAGAPIDALADVQIAPDPGARNPFAPGVRRDGRRRSFTIAVVDEPPPAAGEPRRPNTIYARPDGDAPIELVWRVYEPDRGRDLTGGTGLPRPSLPCAEINDPNREVTVQTTPAEVWRGATSAPGCDPQTSPAYDPVRWERFFNLDYASLGVVTDCTQAGWDARRAMGAEPEGGFYSNRDNAYIYAHTSRAFGPLLVLEGKLPTTPRTYDRERRMGRAQLRYWSVCQNESRVTTRGVDCVADREVPLHGDRRFTIVVARPADRPANARPRCGVAWLDWGERGDAAGRPDYGLLIVRNMLPATGFREAIQNVAAPGAEPAVMGDYFPRSTYTTKAAFEARGCGRGA
jgi:hypothetical protein